MVVMMRVSVQRSLARRQRIAHAVIGYHANGKTVEGRCVINSGLYRRRCIRQMDYAPAERNDRHPATKPSAGSRSGVVKKPLPVLATNAGMSHTIGEQCWRCFQQVVFTCPFFALRALWLSALWRDRTRCPKHGNLNALHTPISSITTTPRAMKFLIVDDHPLILSALEKELGSTNECLLAASLQESLVLVDRHRDLDLIIFDPGLPDNHAAEGLMRLRLAAPAVPLLVLSGNTEPREIQNALELGAAGFVPKTIGQRVLKQAIELIMAGGVYVPPELAGLKKRTQRAQTTGKNVTMKMTPREKQVVPLLTLGYSNKAIASELGISENTARVHVARILKKLNAFSRTQAVAKLMFGKT
jgi:DNA-binding NarL/FixJ family response regulator